MKTLKIRNGLFSALIRATAIKLTFERSKKRNVFLKALTPATDTFEMKRSALCIAHSKKDADGKAIVEKGVYVLEDKEKFNEEYAKLLDEETELQLTPEVEGSLKEIKTIILENKEPVSIAETDEFEALIEAIDNLK